MMRKKRKIIGKKGFETFLILNEAGLTGRKIAEILGVSQSAVSFYKRAKTWDGLLELRKQQVDAHRAKRNTTVIETPHEKIVTASGLVINNKPKMTAYEMRMVNLMTELVKAVEDLNQSWLAEPRKKSIFG